MNKNNLRRIAVFMAMMAASPQMKASASTIGKSITLAYGGPSYFKQKIDKKNFKQKVDKKIGYEKFYKNPKIMVPASVGGAVFLTGVTLLSLWSAGVIGKKENEKDKNNKGIKEENKKTEDVIKSSAGSGIKTAVDMYGGPKFFSKVSEKSGDNLDTAVEEKNKNEEYWKLIKKFKSCNSLITVASYGYKLQNNKRVSEGEQNKLKTVTLDKEKFGELRDICEIFEKKSLGFESLKCLTLGDDSFSWQRTFDKGDPHVNEFIKKLDCEQLKENKKTRIEIQDISDNGVYVAIDQINENENENEISTSETGNGLYFIIGNR